MADKSDLAVSTMDNVCRELSSQDATIGSVVQPDGGYVSAATQMFCPDAGASTLPNPPDGGYSAADSGYQASPAADAGSNYAPDANDYESPDGGY